jgi:aldehyde:ferredoxin oxidoreductase
MNIYRDGKTDLDYWTNAITNVGLYQVGMDMIGVCKFVGIFVNHDIVVRAINGANDLCLSAEEITAAVRRSYLRGLALERRQGYTDEEYTLPAQAFEYQNENVHLPKFVTPEFFAELKQRVWKVFEPEMEGLLN